MRIYELTFILSPNLDEETIKTSIGNIESQIKGLGGSVLEIQRLGTKSFAFYVKGHRQGIYVTVYYEADGNVCKPVETAMKLNESILRFLTIVLEPSEYKPKPKEEMEVK